MKIVLLKSSECQTAKIKVTTKLCISNLTENIWMNPKSTVMDHLRK